MPTPDPSPLIGIDVGGPKKGCHAAALRMGHRFERFHSRCPDALAAWCRSLGPAAIGIDAPCAWAVEGRSRLAERALAVAGRPVACFKTPARERARGNPFYDWVFQGEKLYLSLQLAGFSLYDGKGSGRGRLFETFPHAIACALAGGTVPARNKAATRREQLRAAGYAVDGLSHIDWVDAALCAVAAERFQMGRTVAFGDQREGFIVIPMVESAGLV